MKQGLIAARYDCPVIELRPLAVDFSRTIEDMVGGLQNTNADITSAHFPECRRGKSGAAELRLFLAKPLQTRQHLPKEDVVQRLADNGFVPVDLPELAALKDHADELWAAGVPFVTALGDASVWQCPDGGYSPYLILNPEDRGFHLHWLEGEWSGLVWSLVSRNNGGM
jgi:hypothetical protein